LPARVDPPDTTRADASCSTSLRETAGVLAVSMVASDIQQVQRPHSTTAATTEATARIIHDAPTDAVALIAKMMNAVEAAVRAQVAFFRRQMEECRRSGAAPRSDAESDSTFDYCMSRMALQLPLTCPTVVFSPASPRLKASRICSAYAR